MPKRTNLIAALIAAGMAVGTGCGVVPIPGVDLGQLVAEYDAKQFIHDQAASLTYSRRGTVGEYWHVGGTQQYGPSEPAYSFSFKLSKPSNGVLQPPGTGSASPPTYLYAEAVVAGSDGRVLEAGMCPGLPCTIEPGSSSVPSPTPSPSR